MLSAPLPINTNAPQVNGAMNPLAQPVITSADATTVNPTQENNAVVELQQGEVFAGQLNEVLLNTEPVLPELTESQSAQSQSAQQHAGQPNPEVWLQAMLDQQQLQLEARDGEVPAVANDSNAAEVPNIVETIVETLAVSTHASVVSTPANAVSVTQDPNAIAAIARETFSNTAADAGSLSDKVVNQGQHESARVVQSPVNDNFFDSVAKVIPRHSVSPAVANVPPAIEMRNADESNVVSGTANSVTAISSSATSVLQQVTAAMSDVNTSEPTASTLASTALTATEGAQRSVQTQLSLHASEAKWGEQLLHTLRDQVQVQIQQKIQNATIRLDPPELGSLEIYLSHESGRLHVQITASQADVARLIQQTSDRLRQELSSPQFTQVNIQTSAEGQSGQQQSRERQRFINDELILTNEQAFVGSDQQTKRSSDVLVTV